MSPALDSSCDELSNHDRTPLAPRQGAGGNRRVRILRVLSAGVVVTASVAALAIPYSARVPDRPPQRVPIADDGEVPALLAKGFAAMRRGDLTRANASFVAALALDPGNARILYDLGIVAIRAGSPEQALQFFRRAVTADPTLIEARYNLAATLALLGRKQAAIEGYRAVLAQEPGFDDAKWNLGMLLYSVGRTREGRDMLRMVLQSDPSYRRLLPSSVDLG